MTSFSSSANASVPTPAFARWSLSQNCDYREQASDPFDPISVERELRPLQEASLARAESRIVDGIAIERSDWGRLKLGDGTLVRSEIRGFSVAEILDYYGDEESADATCLGCPANTGEDRGSKWAGCFGLVLPADGASPADLDSALEASGTAELLDAAFPPTKPRWFGWWIDGEWSVTQAEAFLAALDRPAFDGTTLKQRLARGDELHEALARSLGNNLTLRVAAFPPGRIESRNWIVDPHCPRCKAPAEASAKFCRVCRRAGGMFPVRVRKARGERPYHPLGKLISAERIDAVAEAVARSRIAD
ncbi:MAG TPA: hypothetical protein VGN57_10730 [Pirellulaceae bacterium]|jgi:hypothetical protein|nr:hypothetical protein [Pirellulaceae bacterium]